MPLLCSKLVQILQRKQLGVSICTGSLLSSNVKRMLGSNRTGHCGVLEKSKRRTKRSESDRDKPFSLGKDFNYPIAHGVSCMNTISTRLCSNTPPEYTLVYRFPYIVHLKVFQRLKIYQTASLFGFTIYVGVNHLDKATVPILVMTLATVTLYLLSIYARKTMGLLSLSKDLKTVRASHLTFWGKRKDLYLPINNVVPFSELPSKHGDIYRDFRTYDGSIHLYIFLRSGEVHDREKFAAILGQDI